MSRIGNFFKRIFGMSGTDANAAASQATNLKKPSTGPKVKYASKEAEERVNSMNAKMREVMDEKMKENEHNRTLWDAQWNMSMEEHQAVADAERQMKEQSRAAEMEKEV